MALGPKQMGEAIIRNLKVKTGKSVEGWVALLKTKGLQEKKEIIAFLKTDNGLGHFQAQKVFEHFNGKDNYENPSIFAEKIFNTQESRELYEYSKSKILEIAEDIRIQPCKTYIPFYRNKQFAILTKTKDQELILGINLCDFTLNPRFSNASPNGSARINAQTIIQCTSDFDQEIISVLKQAYKAN